MKKSFLFVIVSLSLNCYALTQNDSLSLAKIDSLETRIQILETSNKFNHSESIIKEYKDLNNLYSVGFGILIGLFGLVFPLILYLVQVKPTLETIKETKALVKKLDEDFEKSFEKHLTKSKSKLVDQAIKSFESFKEHNLPTNFTLLDTYKSEGFNEIQVIRLINLLKNRNIEENDKEFISSLMIFQRDENTENYFVELLENNPKDEKCIWGAIYFANYNKTEYYDLIAGVIINGYSIIGMFSSLASSNKNFAIGLFDNEKLANKHEFKEIKNFCDFLSNNNSDTLKKVDVENTLIWKTYLKKQ